MAEKLLILGLGNLVLKDEGVGIHAIQELEKEDLPEHVDLLDGGTGGISLIGTLQEYKRVIMIDATLDNNPSGTIKVIKPKYSTDYPTLLSAHEIGLRD
ncbi:MAG: hydrogenase maturation protease, partial [Bacteroidales bacterium]